MSLTATATTIVGRAFGEFYGSGNPTEPSPGVAMNQPVPADLRAAVRERRSVLEQLSLDLHGTPETRFEEHYAVEQLAGRLAAEGFEVNKGVAGLPTAFTAVHRGPVDGPTVAVLLEYDALPGIGHACGHNLIAAGGLTAAVAAAAVRP